MEDCDTDTLKAKIAALEAKKAEARRTPADDGRAAAVLVKAPAARAGESALTSRPFRLLNLMAAIANPGNRDYAKVEVETCRTLQKAMDAAGCTPADWGGGAPVVLGSAYLPDRLVYGDEYKLVKAVMAAEAADPDEVAWLGERVPRLRKTAMSWLDSSVGGALVAPPEQGELIELMRSREVLQRAGAKMYPLPPQGRVVFPRQTGPSTGYWITENTAITESNPTTGQGAMAAKKLAVLFRVPNELFKFASAAADALLRADAAKTLALGFDYAALYGDGNGQPKGLVNYTGANELISHTATVTGSNGDTLQPEDGFKMAGKVEDRNFDFEGWVMRPTLWAKTAATRAGAAAVGDGGGQFVQAQFRELGAGAGQTWCGYAVNKSTVVRNTLTKGASGATLSEVFGGAWSELLLGMYGALEFSTAPGETAFIADQTLIKGVMFCDSLPRYPGAFVRCGSLLVT